MYPYKTCTLLCIIDDPIGNIALNFLYELLNVHIFMNSHF